MISIFNGRSRGIGQAERNEVYIRVSVALREHLKHFKGARLGIFLAIALHSDERGRASPSVDLLRKETGYNKETIAKALTDLCALTIDGARVLLAIQERDKGGTFTKNEYLVFPSPEEVNQYEAANVVRKARKTAEQPAEPSTEKPDTVEPSTEKPCPVEPSTVFAYGRITTLKNNHGGGGEPPEHVRYLLDQGVGAAELFADLDPETVIQDYKNRRADGQPKGVIVKAWKACPPEKGRPYERSHVSQNTAERPPAPARRSNRATAHLTDDMPAWMRDELAKHGRVS